MPLTHPFMPNHSPIPNDADVSDQMREIALKRTVDMLRKLDQVRRTLEMPVDQLPIVIETYGKVVHALMAEAAREDLAKRTTRLPITMRSENRDNQPMKVLPGKPFAVVVRPQIGSYRPEDFAIHGDRSRWMVHDVKVGNRSQFVSRRGPALGTEFGPGGICEHLRLETLQLAMDLVMEVEYIGPESDGEVFEATVVGIGVNY